MVFKPFKPPLIRRPSLLQSQPSSNDTGDSNFDGPPAKKQRLESCIGKETADDSKYEADKKDCLSSVQEKTVRVRTITNRGPLHQVKNAVASSTAGPEATKHADTSSGIPGEDHSDERYYNVLWYGLLILNLFTCLPKYHLLCLIKSITGANSPPRKTKLGTGMAFCQFLEDMHTYATFQEEIWAG